MRKSGLATGWINFPGVCLHADEYKSVTCLPNGERGSGSRRWQRGRKVGRAGSFQHVRQRVQIPAMLDLLGDDIAAGHAGDGTAQVRRQEVMNRPLPPAHAGADSFLLGVLAESSTFLGELGMERSGDIAHGVGCALISFEEELFGVLTEEASQPAMHGLLLSAAQVATEGAVAAVDQLPVDVAIIGRNDRSDVPILAVSFSEYILNE